MNRSPPLPLLLPLLLLTAGAAAQKVRLGPCPNILPVFDFNITAYSGLWYENRKFLNYFELGVKCVTARYSDDLGGFISVENSGYRFTKPVRNLGYAYLTGEPQVGALAVGVSNRQDRPDANYNVIKVEYDRYAVVYSCSNLLGKASHVELLWLLTRQAKFPSHEANAIIWDLTKRGILQAFQMKKTDQYFCPGRYNTLTG